MLPRFWGTDFVPPWWQREILCWFALPIYCRFDDLDGHIFKPSRSAFFDGTDFHKSIPFVAFRPPESRKRSPFPFRTHSRSARNRAAFRPDFAHDRSQKYFRGLHAGRKRFFWEGRGEGFFFSKKNPSPQSPPSLSLCGFPTTGKPQKIAAPIPDSCAVNAKSGRLSPRFRPRQKPKIFGSSRKARLRRKGLER